MATAFVSSKNACKQLHVGLHDMNQTYTMKRGKEFVPIEKVDSDKDLSVIKDTS